jgi:hypothetical protein
MKSMAMLVAATAAALAVNTSGALSQGACSKAYAACMSVCVERPSKNLQDTCMNSCQSNNNRCTAEAYGGRRETGPTVVSQPPAEGKKALAKEAASPPPRNVDVAPRKAEGSLRQVDVPPRRKAEAPVQEAPAAKPKAVEAQK